MAKNKVRWIPSYFYTYGPLSEALVGKTISAIEIADDGCAIRFRSPEGDAMFITEGDCCSETWINDISGVASLLGHRVVSADPVFFETGTRHDEDSRDVSDKPQPREGTDVVIEYAFKIVTDAGYCDIIYRNDSNGYYGGSLKVGEPEDPVWKPVTEDWSAGVFVRTT